MNLNKIVLTLLISNISFICQGQVHIDFLDNSKTKNFEDIVSDVEAYYTDKDKGRGSGYKQFKRWEHYNATRLSTDGKIVHVAQRNFDEFYYYQENWRNKHAISAFANSNILGGNWESVAPKNYSLIVDATNTDAVYNGGLGRVNVIEIDPHDYNIIYIGTPGGGLWRSTNGGGTWEALTDGLPRLGISGIAIDYNSPPDNRTIYILTGDGNGSSTRSIGVLKSMDNGYTWHGTDLKASDLQQSYKIIIHPENPDILYVADYNGIFKTTNGGLSWVNSTASLGVTKFYDIEFKPGESNKMYASAKDRIYISNDSGDTWNLSTWIPEHSTRRVELAVTPANPDYIYILAGGVWSSDTTPHGFAGLYRSTDSGFTFLKQSDEPNLLGLAINGQEGKDQTAYDLAIAASPVNADEIHIGGINCWKSLDGGVNWINTSYWEENKVSANNYTHADIHDLKFVGSTLYCGSDGGIYKSTDYADNWSSISDGLQITQIYRLDLGTENTNAKSPLYFASQDNGLNALKASSTTALHWFGSDGTEVSVLPNNRYVLGSVPPGSLLLLTDETHIEEVTPPTMKTILPNLKIFDAPLDTHRGLELSPTNNIYVGYQDVFYISSAFDERLGSLGWINITNGAIGTDNCDYLKVAPSNFQYIYVSKGEILYKTTDLGSNWEVITSNLPNQIIPYFTIHPQNPDIVYVVVGSYADGQKVYQTQDGGVSWSNISGSLPNVPVNCITLQNNAVNGLYLGTDTGVFYRDDNLSDWIPFQNYLPNVNVQELKIDYLNNEIYAATLGRGIWKSSLYGNACETNLIISQDLEGLEYFTAENITTTSKVKPLANVNFKVSNSATFNTGFEAMPDSKFFANIDSDACNEAISANKTTTKKRSSYAGPLRGVISLNSEAPDTSLLNELFLFPNPAESDVYLQLEIPNKSNISVNLFNMKGQLILSENKGFKNPGKVVEKINLSQVQSGIYVVKVIVGSFSESKKIVVVK